MKSGQLGCRLRALAKDSARAAGITSGAASTARVVADVALYRALKLGSIPGENRPRSIRLKAGDTITYRLNRGDIQGIREVLVDQVYRPPITIRPRVIVDLGANIGLTSVFLRNLFHPDILIAVEPDPSNANLARLNLGCGATVIEAAVSPRDGIGTYVAARDSNLGSLQQKDALSREDSHSVRLITMTSILSTLPGGRIDLLKMDIEGGEEALLTGQTDWLSSVGAIIAEFHPDRVDYPGLVESLVASGFRYTAAGSVWPGSMDFFVRDREWWADTTRDQATFSATT